MGHKIRQPREGQPRDLGSGSTSTGLNAAQKSVDNANEVGFHLILLVLAPPPPHLSALLSTLWALPTHKRESFFGGGALSRSARSHSIHIQKGEG